MQKVRRAVVLMNLGSPDSTAVKDVKTYLGEFLMDKRVIDSPYLLRLFLVKGIITPFRAPQSATAYRSIWTKDGSPLIVLTNQLQVALRNEIEEPVAVAMRYGNPSPKAAFDSLAQQYPDLEEVILFPLYPHYAMSSYETAIVYAEDIHKKGKYNFQLKSVKPFYNEPAYIDALAESIRPYLGQDYDQILFSYHSIPEAHVIKGDITGRHCMKAADCCSVDSEAHKQCYRHQCFVTTKLVVEKLNIPSGKHAVSFQSRLGRAEWLKPYTAKRLEELPGEGVKKILVVCPAFVSDCLETLEEMGIEGKESFLHAGGTSFTLIPCMNVHPKWVQTVAGWVKEIADGGKRMVYGQ
ncbi:ferrochelatase [Chitinophagaceae bacterium MMS25-I14]